MQLKIPLKRLFYTFGIIIIIFFLIATIFLVFYLPGHAYTYYYKKDVKAVPGLPIRLVIPKINVDTDVKYVGLDAKGAMDMPKTSDEVAWYKFGPRPGENGSAVIAGHYGFWKSGQGSVFDNLNKLRKGDKLYIEDEKGAIITFVVSALKRYNSNADASDVFNSSDDKAHLNLITCEGIWDATKQTYSDRLVIFTDKEIQ